MKDEAVDDLGDEAWRFWFVPGAQATYHWRRSNLTFEVHMDCLYMCADVDAALHDWATEIDRAARDL